MYKQVVGSRNVSDKQLASQAPVFLPQARMLQCTEQDELVCLLLEENTFILVEKLVHKLLLT